MKLILKGSIYINGLIAPHTAKDAASVTLKNFLSIRLGERRAVINVTFRIIKVITGFRVNSANGSHHLRGKKNILYRNDIDQ